MFQDVSGSAVNDHGRSALRRNGRRRGLSAQCVQWWAPVLSIIHSVRHSFTWSSMLVLSVDNGAG
jgi:hypothetical protein